MTNGAARTWTIGAMVAGLLSLGPLVRAHSGPPFPILSNRLAGAYEISIWTDPDATDDGQPGGQFWIVVQPTEGTTPIPVSTRISVAIRPVDREGGERVAWANPVDGLVSRQFAALVMDHEGRFTVRVIIEGPLGRADVSSAVEATYDLRPAPVLLVVYLLPFLAVGALWVTLLRRRSRVVHPRA